MGGDVWGGIHPCEVTKKPKTHGVAEEGEAPVTGGRVGRIWKTGGDPYTEERNVGTDFCGDTVVFGLWSPCSTFVFDVRVVDTDIES